ncbi:MAG: hypothetical protein AMXMBFR64_51500 [Myxococcales bacterium]
MQGVPAVDGGGVARRIDALVLLAIIVFVAAHCLVKYEPYTFIFRDGSFYSQTNRSIAQGFTLRQEEVQPGSWYDGSLPWYRDVDKSWSNISVGGGGEYYPKHSFLMPVMSTPFYLLLGLPGLLVFNCVALVLGMWAGYRLGARFAGEGASAVATMALLATPLVPYLAYCYSFDVFYGALVAGGAALIAARWGFAGGLLMGLSLWAKPTNVLLAGPLVLALTAWDRRFLGRLVLGGAIPIALAALANAVMYGLPWLTSYHRILVVEAGVPKIVSLGGEFDIPLGEGLRRFWKDADGFGLREYVFLPVVGYVGVVPLAVSRWWREGRAGGEWKVALALLVSMVGFGLLFGRYVYMSARFFMPWVMVGAVPLAALIGASLWGADRIVRWVGRPAVRRWAAWGVVAGLLGVTVARAAAGGAPSLHADVERLEVTLAGTPCDYLNLTHMKWECSRREARGGYLVGRALGDQCGQFGEPMLWAPMNPDGRVRVLRWTVREDAAGLDLVWGLDETAERGEATFTVQVGAESFTGRTGAPGEVQRHRLEVPVVEGTPVTVTIPGTRHQRRFLCLNVVAR